MDDARLERIAELCVTGEALARQRELAPALLKFREALALIPRPVEEHDVSPRVLTALGDTCFQLGRFSEGRHALLGAARSSGGLGTPFIHLRLGQCELELGNPERAAEELARALKLGGEVLFEGNDPKYLAFVKTRP
ncbi:tetratricopeptide repeat protein [Archangium gephyra]|uniref:tetratricopeptide repeat protein n=1 Tax=Archangium gephyra TaxID=48 RepID=UPI0035D41B9F